MALGIARAAGNFVSGNKRVRTRTLTFDSSYPTGGYAITPQQVGMNKVIDFAFGGVATLTADGSTARGVSYNYTTNKIQVYVLSTGAEVANAVDLSTFSVRMQFVGS